MKTKDYIFWIIIGAMLIISSIVNWEAATDIFIVIYVVVSLPCAVFTVFHVASLWRKKDRREELIDLYDRRIGEYKVLTKRKAVNALRHSINDFCKQN